LATTSLCSIINVQENYQDIQEDVVDCELIESISCEEHKCEAALKHDEDEPDAHHRNSRTNLQQHHIDIEENVVDCELIDSFSCEEHESEAALKHVEDEPDTHHCNSRTNQIINVNKKKCAALNCNSNSSKSLFRFPNLRGHHGLCEENILR